MYPSAAGQTATSRRTNSGNLQPLPCCIIIIIHFFCLLFLLCCFSIILFFLLTRLPLLIILPFFSASYHLPLLLLYIILFSFCNNNNNKRDYGITMPSTTRNPDPEMHCTIFHSASTLLELALRAPWFSPLRDRIARTG